MRHSSRRAMEAVFFVVIGLLLLGQTMAKPLDHDENQFVASGWLLAHGGLLPYRDYPYFHLPYLSVLYAIAYAFTSYPLLVARLIETVAAWGSALVLYAVLASTDKTWK